ncbi:MAG: NYN domain-containing protein [Coriobacteriia bacterium]|nr:NYN domain-containing protein [Coriobacteriia bacterium]
MDRLIIDGYNVLHAHPRYAALAASDFDSAREHLVADLAGLAQGGPRVVVVFDGGANPASDGAPHHIGALAVVFSAAGTDADTVIEALAARSRERGERAVVVTSDSATRQVVRTGSVSVLSAENFIADLESSTDEVRRLARAPGRVALGQRIDPEVGAALSRWARGGRDPRSIVD